jgi:flagellum-specific ATP synthase
MYEKDLNRISIMGHVTAFSILSKEIRSIQARQSFGRVSKTLGLSLFVDGIQTEVAVGDKCLVHTRNGKILGEVVDSSEENTVILPFGTWNGVSVGDKVEKISGSEFIYPSDEWIGRVVNALGDPIDSKGSHIHQGRVKMPFRADPMNAHSRKRVGAKINTCIKAVDIFTPICQGQRMGVFAGSGVGKSSTISTLARNSEADIIVIGLIGERGREVKEFIQDDLGEDGMARSVLVVSTGDEPPLMRRQAAWTAMAVAEYFRDRGKNVFLLLDSVTRFAMAQREIGLAAGEPPTTKGYPPTVFTELPRLLERAGPGPDGYGDITGVFSVLVDGDDHNEPISDAVRGITDGHIVLDRKIAESGIYPAINILKSVSRMLPDCHSQLEFAIMKECKSLMARFDDMEDMIRIGAYKKGQDQFTDASIVFHELMRDFLNQAKTEVVKSSQAFGLINEALIKAGVLINLNSDSIL